MSRCVQAVVEMAQTRYWHVDCATEATYRDLERAIAAFEAMCPSPSHLRKYDYTYERAKEALKKRPEPTMVGYIADRVVCVVEHMLFPSRRLTRA
jgi:hypothetical protein